MEWPSVMATVAVGRPLIVAGIGIFTVSWAAPYRKSCEARGASIPATIPPFARVFVNCVLFAALGLTNDIPPSRATHMTGLSKSTHLTILLFLNYVKGENPVIKRTSNYALNTRTFKCLQKTPYNMLCLVKMILILALRSGNIIGANSIDEVLPPISHRRSLLAVTTLLHHTGK